MLGRKTDGFAKPKKIEKPTGFTEGTPDYDEVDYFPDGDGERVEQIKEEQDENEGSELRREAVRRGMRLKKGHSGSKYDRLIYPKYGGEPIVVDVYDVLEAFDARNPAICHSIKKTLCFGIRGKATPEQDLREAIDAIERGIELETRTNGEQNNG